MTSRTLSRLGIALLALMGAAMFAGCAKTHVTSREPVVTEKLPRPATIFVYNFAATPSEIPSESALAGQDLATSSYISESDKVAARDMGRQMAAHLVDAIRRLGLQSEVGTAVSKPQVNDIVIRGYFVSMEEGDTAKRVVIGFGSGNSELRTVVEGFQMTPTGLRRVGSATVDSEGNKTPGAAFGAATWAITKSPLGLIVSLGTKVYGEESGRSTLEGRSEATTTEIADTLKQRFKDQGWIS